MKDRFYEAIMHLDDVEIQKNVSVKNNTNLKIDTVFKYRIITNNNLSIKKVFLLIRKYKKKYIILGKGSNVLFKKTYYNKVLIILAAKHYDNLSVVSAGISLNMLNQIFINKGISSFIFLIGVPCSLGGAIYMNAGAFNHTISQVIEYVYVLDLNDYRFKVLSNEECKFGYRDSYFKHNNLFIIGAKIKLYFKNLKELEEEKKYYLTLRKEKLPLEYPNLGSTFKNPTGTFAGKLIEDVGLKAYKYKGFMVSEKHANVIVNLEEGKGKDMIKLIEIIKRKVYRKTKERLDLEIIIK